jgi:hypothetical protein
MQRKPDDLPRETPVEPGGNVTTPYPEGPSNSEQFQCKICGQLFTNQADLTQHMRMHEVSGSPDPKKDKEAPAGVS